MDGKYTPMANFFRATTERFWHIEHLEFIIGQGFNEHAAAWLAHEGLKERRANAVRPV